MTTRLGPVHLSVGDLDVSRRYYEEGLGLKSIERSDGRLTLGAGEGRLVLHEQPGARPAGATAGLFHFALLVPGRRELGRSIRRLTDAGLKLTGASDHLVSEAVYLRDPDGHGIEIYRDRLREQWDIDGSGRVVMASIALDIAGVMAEIGDAHDVPATIDPATVMGHVHLQASVLEPTRAFHIEALGLSATASIPQQAEFLAWDGYHHHVGMNVWAGSGIPPAPPETARLLHWTAHVDDPSASAGRAAASGAQVEEREDGLLVRDPSGIAVLLAAHA